MAPLWQPLLDDMSAAVGVKVKPYFATNYTSLVEAMRFKQVQVGWFSASPALSAVNRADAEVVGRIVDAGGDATYKSVIIVKKDSGITLDRVLKCDRTLNFGIGDAQSTSGTLAPMTYLFTPKGIDVNKCFKTVRSASHQGQRLLGRERRPGRGHQQFGGPGLLQGRTAREGRRPQGDLGVAAAAGELHRRAQGPGSGAEGEDPPVLPHLRHRRRPRRPEAARGAEEAEVRRLPAPPTTPTSTRCARWRPARRWPRQAFRRRRQDREG
jgi:hypothetical protein